uniref:Uncharacterized protein n=1 Tax=Octopus bimaculoides TaxID=37653 RepID=A0A0L8GY60_OCTBM
MLHPRRVIEKRQSSKIRVHPSRLLTLKNFMKQPTPAADEPPMAATTRAADTTLTREQQHTLISIFHLF